MENALIEPTTATGPQAPASRRPRTFDARWALMLALLLGASGLVRYGRDLQFRALENESKASPFPLKEIPTVLGTWKMVEGAETTLDPQIARIAGSSDHIVRTYRSERTGEHATVLVLYGLAPLVWGHTPEICYPATGYKEIAAPRDVKIDVEAAGAEVPFRQAVYGISQGGASSYHDVYYSFRNAGEWAPDMGVHWKRFRSHPGMFKIQVERRVESAGAKDDACRDLLAALVAEIEAKAGGGPKAAKPAGPG